MVFLSKKDTAAPMPNYATESPPIDVIAATKMKKIALRRHFFYEGS